MKALPRTGNRGGWVVYIYLHVHTRSSPYIILNHLWRKLYAQTIEQIGGKDIPNTIGIANTMGGKCNGIEHMMGDAVR